jgi:hypothetical protein
MICVGTRIFSGARMWTWSLRERVGVFFELGETQGPPDVAVSSSGLSQDGIILDPALKDCAFGVDPELSATIDRLKAQPRFVLVLSMDTSIDNHARGTHTSPGIVYGEYTKYGHHMVEPPAQCLAWQPRCGGGCLAGLGLVLTLGNFSPRGKHRRVSDLAGSHDWTGLGLGHPLAWPGKSCMAYRHDGSGPLDHDGADRRTDGDNSLSRSDGNNLGGLLDNDLLWALQTSECTHCSLIN